MNRSRKYESNVIYNNVYDVEAGFVGYIGDIVALSAAGYLEYADGTNTVIGVLKQAVDNSKGGNGDRQVLVNVNPKVWLPFAGAAVTHLFRRFYATDENTIAQGYNPTTKKADGLCIDFRENELLIDFLKGDTAPEAGSGDFMADGSVPMTGNFKLNGKSIWLNVAGTSKIANDGSDNFEWTLGTKYFSFKSHNSGNVEDTLLKCYFDDITNNEWILKSTSGNIKLLNASIHGESGVSLTSDEGGYLEVSDLIYCVSDLKLNDKNIQLGTTTGTKIGTATNQKLAFWNATPVVQQVLATGGGATVDNVISLLQTLGLCKQA